MDRVSSLLPKVLNKHGIKHEADASLIVHYAEQWLKEKCAPEDAMVTKIRDGILVIETGSSASAGVCHALSDDLLNVLQTTFPSFPPGRIRILRKRDAVVG